MLQEDTGGKVNKGRKADKGEGEKKGRMIELDRIYKETVNDCGKNASKELIKQEFLFALREIGEEFAERVEEKG